MNILIARLLNLACGILLIGIGTEGMLDPDGFAAFLQFHLEDSSAVVEFMSAHGGIYFVMGLVMCYCASVTARVYDGLLFVVLMSSGFALGRSLGMILYEATLTHQVWLAIEILLILLGMILLAKR